MANGIPLAQRQRSALLQSLLNQQQQTRPVTPIGAIGQLARQFAVRQIINREEQRERQAAEVAQQQRNVLAQQLVGRTAAERSPSEGREALLSALVRSGTPQANALLSQLGPSLLGIGGQQEPLEIIQGPEGPQFVERSRAVGERPAARPTAEKTEDFFAFSQSANKDVRVTEKGGRFFVGDKEVSGTDLSPATNKVLQGELGKSVKDSIQKQVVEKLDILRDLEELKDFDPRRFLTTAGKVTRFVSEVADRLNLAPEAAQKFLQDDVNFRQGVEGLFFRLRKEITGAQAAVQELEQLKDSVLSTKLSPTQFEASFTRYQTRIRDAVMLRQRLLQEGLAPGTEEFNSAFDSLFTPSNREINFEDL